MKKMVENSAVKDFKKVKEEPNVEISSNIKENQEEKKTSNAKKDVESTRMYLVYMDFMYYIEMITEKYPNSTKSGIVANIKTYTYHGMQYILEAYKAFDKKEKLYYLNKLDITLKMLKVFARISNKRKYINGKNYEAWSRKLNKICMSLGGWINSCLKP